MIVCRRCGAEQNTRETCTEGNDFHDAFIAKEDVFNMETKHTQRLTALSMDPDCAEYDMECGCKLDATGHDLPDFGFCAMHAAAPDMLEALRRCAIQLEAFAEQSKDPEVLSWHRKHTIDPARAIINRIEKGE